VTIISAFRQASTYISAYCTQMDGLQNALAARGDSLQLVLGYGDSTDATPAILFDECANRFDCLLLDVSHGGPVFGSVEHPQRFKQLAFVGNKLWAHIPDAADVVALVESDLIWQTNTMLALIDHTATYPVIAPLIMDFMPWGRFRDVYAFRRGGDRFTSYPPYHADLNGEVLQVDSAGSVLVMRGELARGLCWPQEDVVVGVCRQIYERGGAVYVDPALKVIHP
jgi:hypothetical protein